MTREEIDKLRELEKAATPGEWECQIPAMMGEFPHCRIKPLKITGKLYGTPMIKTQDGEFIAESRNAMPKLLDYIDKLEQALDHFTKECKESCYCDDWPQPFRCSYCDHISKIEEIMESKQP